MEIITYSLRDGQKRSDQYYDDIAAFTDEVIAEAENQVGPVVDAFKSYVRRTGCESPRSVAELAFELLTLGVLWRVYASGAPDVAAVPQRVFASLARLRRRGGWLKSGVDVVRGILGTLLLSPNGHHATEPPQPTLARLDRLVDWLAATDNFKQEVKRLRAWRAFLVDQLAQDAARSLMAVIAFAGWFEARSETVLGHYTPNVEKFLRETHPGYRWQENLTFCGRKRVEYHLNMVGTEVLNRAFREAFLVAERKIVIVPPCMRAKQDGCLAQETPFGARCAACTPGCRVNQITKLGEKHGFQVLIMPDDLPVFSGGGDESLKGGPMGVVGVSCALTNASGGWETKELGIPAQGVLLDYCGCHWHWHKDGIPTDTNSRQLLRVVGVAETQPAERQSV